MKLLLPYFIKFLIDNTMVPNKYLYDCTMRRLEKRQVIINIYDKSVFLANDNCK